MKQQASKRVPPRQPNSNQSKSPVIAGGRSRQPTAGSPRRKSNSGKRPQLAGLLRTVVSHCQRLFSKRLAGHPMWMVSIAATLISFIAGQGLGMVLAGMNRSPNATAQSIGFGGSSTQLVANSRPQLNPLPAAQEVWTCDVVVIGGSLGGVAAASHAMRSGATTCLIELTPWLGGQVSSQGVSALDESQELQSEETLTKSWTDFKQLLRQQPVQLPSWTKIPAGQKVDAINSCWVGLLCFPPQVGAVAAEQLLKSSRAIAPTSHWSVSTAFKGAAFDPSGREITTVYAVRRVPRQPDYRPMGRFSEEIAGWYSWDNDDQFEKIPLKLQAAPGKHLVVIDATDTAELVGWAGVPHRLGSESLATTGERNASRHDNSDCTQAFTYPFVLAIHDDQGASEQALAQLESDYPKAEHRSHFDLQNYPMFSGRSFFNYRRIVSHSLDDPYQATPMLGDMTLVNWNHGNDWKFMDPPLILTDEQIVRSGQQHDWMGGISTVALRHAENNAFLFAHWLLEQYSKEKPLTYVYGEESPLGTQSGLSMVPYIREGRRIVGRRAYNQREFAVREADLRVDMAANRDFSPTAIARIHYSIDIHGCVYRNGGVGGEASSASTLEHNVRPTLIPLEALIPQGIDNLLIGGKGVAVTHIANGMTRIHQSEWGIGAASGAIAGWLVTHTSSKPFPDEIVPRHLMPELRKHLISQGLGLDGTLTSAAGGN